MRLATLTRLGFTVSASAAFIACGVGGTAAPVAAPAGAAAVQPGHLRFFEGNNCTQNQKGATSDRGGQRIDFRNTDGFTNDDARSLQLLNVRTGAVIRVYDNPGGSTNDDWTEIRVRGAAQTYCVGTFERDVNDATVLVTYHRNNGLDGKVSRVEVD